MANSESEYNIKILVIDNQITIQIITDVPATEGGYYHVNFSHECAGKFNAELLARHLTSRHASSIKAIRKAEFMSGWRHAKAKKKGKSFFGLFSSLMKQKATHGYVS